MRRVLGADEKPLHWVGSSIRDGIRTAKRDVDLIADRLKSAQRDHEEHYGKSKR